MLEETLNRFFAERYPRLRQSLLVVSGSAGRRIAYDDIMYIESRRMNVRIVCCHGAEPVSYTHLDCTETRQEQASHGFRLFPVKECSGNEPAEKNEFEAV